MEKVSGAVVSCFKDNLQFSNLLKNINLCNLKIDLFSNQENGKNQPQSNIPSGNFERKFSKLHPSVKVLSDGKRIEQKYSPYGYSELLPLKIENVEECLELQNNMINSIVKTKSRTFIRERNRQDFIDAIEKNELFGVRDKTGKLVGIVMLSPNKYENILEHIEGKGNEKIKIDADMADFLKLGNSCYASCLMTMVNGDLYPKLGSYIGSQIRKIAQEKNYDFVVGEIGVENFKSYKSFCNEGILTFALGHKNVNFKNVSGNFEDLVCFYPIAINNGEIVNILGNSIIQDSKTPIIYNEENIDKIKTSNEKDPILRKNEIVLFENKVPYKVEFNRELLKQNIENYRQKKERERLNKVDFGSSSMFLNSSFCKKVC